MSPRRSAVEVRAILFRVPLSGLRRDLWCGEQMGIYLKAAAVTALFFVIPCVLILLSIGAAQVSPILGYMVELGVPFGTIFWVCVLFQKDWKELQ